MRRRFIKEGNDNSGLIPFADLLSNSVGIIIFVLAFTVLQSAGGVVPMKLPIERSTQGSSSVIFVCYHDKLLPLNTDLTKSLFKGLPALKYDNADLWIRRFTQKRVEDECFTIVPEGETSYSGGAMDRSAQLILSASFYPKANAGEAEEALNRKESQISKSLSTIDSKKQFVYFLVYPDDIDLFRKAREVARTKYGLNVGWGPVGKDEPVRFSLSGGSGIKPQVQ